MLIEINLQLKVRNIMHHLLSCSSFSSLRFVRLEDLFSSSLPLLPLEFEEFIRRQCQTTRDELDRKYVMPVCQTVGNIPSVSESLSSCSN